MKFLWTSEEVLHAVRGRQDTERQWFVHGVSIDSRTIKPGDLFIAIKGPDKDAHDYVANALDAGAVTAIVQRLPKDVSPHAPLVFVDDTFVALQDLGRVGRLRSKAKIIALTGSVGKTGTKEMLRLILAASGNVHANEGSLNNHWGVPLSLARLPIDAEFGVFEIGMNHAGELGPLSREVQPHVSLITNVEAVHMEFFDSVEAIAEAKAEIFLGMNPDGIAVLNRDNHHFAQLMAAAQTQGIRNILCFGRHPDSDARLLNANVTDTGNEVDAVIMNKKYSYFIGAPGEHIVLNSLGALLTAIAAGADITKGMKALETYKPPVGRGNRHIVALPYGSTFTVIDESYNASPASMRAAIRILAQTPTGPGGRHIAVLGDMRELGESSPRLHEELADVLEENRVDIVHCCGNMMIHLYEALPSQMRGKFAKDSSELASLVIETVHAGDVIMVKGSHSIHMERIVESLNNYNQRIPS